jgi:hypothetical protein
VRAEKEVEIDRTNRVGTWAPERFREALSRIQKYEREQIQFAKPVDRFMYDWHFLPILKLPPSSLKIAPIHNAGCESRPNL